MLLITGLCADANVAAADSTQVQSYQRTSQSETCSAQPGETPWQASWGTDSSWHPSWEQWANEGKGGWTCTRSITWARDSAARVYNVGDIGPGGGLVFLIDNGVRYEMAPNTWGPGESGLQWCVDFTDTQSGSGTAIGTGAANTAAMAASVACDSAAAAAVDTYAPPGTSAGQWFLPSLDELNAMCNYSRNPAAPPAGRCTVAQDSTFAASSFGFDGIYWASSQQPVVYGASWIQNFVTGDQGGAYKITPWRVRPIRAF
jgi:hypothetical protein